MTRHLPLLPCALGLALCVWRPEWVSVVVLALLLCFALYLDNRERRSVDVEDLEERVSVVDASTKIANNRLNAMEGWAVKGADIAGHSAAIAALEHDQKKLRADMEAIRVALGSKARATL